MIALPTTSFLKWSENLDKINEVIEKVSLENFVAELPEGINTFVGSKAAGFPVGKSSALESPHVIKLTKNSRVR